MHNMTSTSSSCSSPFSLSLACSLCPIPSNGACTDPTTIAAAAHPRPNPPRRLYQLQRYHNSGSTSCLSLTPLLWYKKIAKRNAHLDIIYIFYTQITASTNSLQDAHT